MLRSVRTEKPYVSQKPQKLDISSKKFKKDKKRISKLCSKVEGILEKTKPSSKPSNSNKSNIAALYPQCFDTWKEQTQNQELRGKDKEEFLHKWYVIESLTVI